jgi:hypothetical protein
VKDALTDRIRQELDLDLDSGIEKGAKNILDQLDLGLFGTGKKKDHDQNKKDGKDR